MTLRRARRLLSAQATLLVWALTLFLTARKSKAKGEWKAAGTWTPEGKPVAEDDLEVTGSFEVKAGLTSVGRSLIATATGILAGAGTITLGTSTEQAEHILIQWSAAATITWTGLLELVSTVTSTAQTIALGGHKLAGAGNHKIKSGRYKLLEAWESASPLLVEGGTLEGNAQTIKAEALGAEATGSINLSGCTIVVAGPGIGWNFAGTGTITTSPTTVFQIGTATFPGAQFGGGGKTYQGEVQLLTRGIKLDSISGQTIEKLAVLNKGVSAEGAKFKPASLTIVTGALTTNGTEAERARVESMVAGEKWKLQLPAASYEPANSFLAVKDCKIEGGTLYLPHGQDLGGNEGIVFGSKKPPAGFIIGSSIEAYTVGEGFSPGEEFAWKFPALESKTLRTLELFTNSVAATATSLVLGILADNAGEPGAVLAQGTFAGKPGSSQWVPVTLNEPVNLVKGTNYWLAILPIGGSVGANLGTENGTDRKLTGAGFTEISTGVWEAEHTTNIGLRGIEGSGAVSLTREAADAISIAETASRTVNLSRSSSDPLSLAETPSRTVATSRSSSDGLSISESPSRVVADARAGADPVSMAEAPTRTVALTRSSSDPVGLAEAPSRVVTDARTVADPVSIAETATRSRGLTREAVDAITITETPSRTVAFVRAAADTLHLADTPTRAVHLLRQAADAINISEAVEVRVGRATVAKVFARMVRPFQFAGRIVKPKTMPGRVVKPKEIPGSSEVQRP